jgi:hypothetical protein
MNAEYITLIAIGATFVASSYSAYVAKKNNGKNIESEMNKLVLEEFVLAKNELSVEMIGSDEQYLKYVSKEEIEISYKIALRVYRKIYCYLLKDDRIFLRELMNEVLAIEYDIKSDRVIWKAQLNYIENLHDVISRNITSIWRLKYS